MYSRCADRPAVLSPSSNQSGRENAHIPTTPCTAVHEALAPAPCGACPDPANPVGSAARAVGSSVGNSRLRPTTTLPSMAALTLKLVHTRPASSTDCARRSGAPLRLAATGRAHTAGTAVAGT